MLWLWVASYLLIGFTISSVAVAMSKRASAEDGQVFMIVVMFWLPLLIFAAGVLLLKSWIEFLGRFQK